MSMTHEKPVLEKCSRFIVPISRVCRGPKCVLVVFGHYKSTSPNECWRLPTVDTALFKHYFVSSWHFN